MKKGFIIGLAIAYLFFAFQKFDIQWIEHCGEYPEFERGFMALVAFIFGAAGAVLGLSTQNK